MEQNDPDTATELYSGAQTKEQELRALLKTKPSESPEAMVLRSQISKSYVRLIQLDPKFAASKDVEQSLWKSCYYKRIEDFRKYIRKYANQAVSSRDPASRAHLHTICTSFGYFLREASVFYNALLNHFSSQMQLAKQNMGENGSIGTSEDISRISLSLHRCLIFLGDLARYRELHSENRVKKWEECELYYQRALEALPGGGNPHNQLAVLATYTEAECVAVYRYCRSLLIDQPFMTARENLALLYEKNRQKLIEESTEDPSSLHPDAIALKNSIAAMSGLPGSGLGVGMKVGGKGAGGRGNTGALLKSFLRRFVRLHGILFTAEKAGLADFAGMFSTVITDFGTLLTHSAFGDALLLKMVVICTFTVITTAQTPENTGSSPGGKTAEEPVRQTCMSWALALAFGIAAQIGNHVRTHEGGHSSRLRETDAGAGGEGNDEQSGIPRFNLAAWRKQQQFLNSGAKGEEGSGKITFNHSASRLAVNQPQPRPLGSRLLGPVVLFCDWLEAQPQYCIESVFDAGGDPRSFQQERLMRTSLWTTVCHLANSLPSPAPTMGTASDTSAGGGSNSPQQRSKFRALREHVELRGYLPLQELYHARYFMHTSPSSGGTNSLTSALSSPPSPPLGSGATPGEADDSSVDDGAGGVRISSIKAFCNLVARGGKNEATPMKIIEKVDLMAASQVPYGSSGVDSRGQSLDSPTTYFVYIGHGGAQGPDEIKAAAVAAATAKLTRPSQQLMRSNSLQGLSSGSQRLQQRLPAPGSVTRSSPGPATLTRSSSQTDTTSASLMGFSSSPGVSSGSGGAGLMEQIQWGTYNSNHNVSHISRPQSLQRMSSADAMLPQSYQQNSHSSGGMSMNTGDILREGQDTLHRDTSDERQYLSRGGGGIMKPQYNVERSSSGNMNSSSMLGSYEGNGGIGGMMDSGEDGADVIMFQPSFSRRRGPSGPPPTVPPRSTPSSSSAYTSAVPQSYNTSYSSNQSRERDGSGSGNVVTSQDPAAVGWAGGWANTTATSSAIVGDRNGQGGGYGSQSLFVADSWSSSFGERYAGGSSVGDKISSSEQYNPRYNSNEGSNPGERNDRERVFSSGQGGQNSMLGHHGSFHSSSSQHGQSSSGGGGVERDFHDNYSSSGMSSSYRGGSNTNSGSMPMNVSAPTSVPMRSASPSDMRTAETRRYANPGSAPEKMFGFMSGGGGSQSAHHMSGSGMYNSVPTGQLQSSSIQFVDSRPFQSQQQQQQTLSSSSHSHQGGGGGALGMGGGTSQMFSMDRQQQQSQQQSHMIQQNHFQHQPQQQQEQMHNNQQTQQRNTHSGSPYHNFDPYEQQHSHQIQMGGSRIGTSNYPVSVSTNEYAEEEPSSFLYR